MQISEEDIMILKEKGLTGYDVENITLAIQVIAKRAVKNITNDIDIAQIIPIKFKPAALKSTGKAIDMMIEKFIDDLEPGDTDK